MRRMAITLAATAALALAAFVPTTASAAWFTKCGRVAYAGEKVPVYAHKLPCDKAKRIARNWLRTDKPPVGWRVNNFAGCEWLFARRSDSLYGPRVSVDVVRYEGCTS